MSSNVIPMSIVSSIEEEKVSANSVYAALARTTTRSLALYFSRPVRLFRPSKVSGWHSLRGHALQNGSILSPAYIRDLISKNGIGGTLFKHFAPPVLINAALGTVLWTVYAETSTAIQPYMENHPTSAAAISGGCAGLAQALVSAPAENVRRVLEGGHIKGGWSHAWRDVFVGSSPRPGEPSPAVKSTSTVGGQKKVQLKEIRELRHWMSEVGDMAGRGWHGWRWGVAKDVCGFAAFFSIFEVTRRFAATTKDVSQELSEKYESGDLESIQTFRQHFPRTVHAVTLVCGGVVAGLSYELTGRPWDVARHTLHAERTTGRSVWTSLHEKYKTDGWVSFFRDPVAVPPDAATLAMSKTKRRMYSTLKTVARMGPWGVGFLVWQIFMPEGL